MSTLSKLPLGALAPFHEAGVLDIADVQVAATVLRIGGFGLTDPADVMVGLGAALCVRALRAGSVCVDLTEDPTVWLPETVDAEPPDLRWPTTEDWLAAVSTHPLVSADDRSTPLRLAGTLLYLQRYWQDEDLIRAEMRRRARFLPVTSLGAGLDRLFGQGPDLQRLAAATAASRAVCIVAGGPGTGKTTTVAKIIALLRQTGAAKTVALAAPTGKAAARLQEAVAQVMAGWSQEDRQRVGPTSAATIHRLLGWRPDAQGRFRHDGSNPLPHDVVIVDETSMVSLPLMARLLEAVRPDARLVLVGDPDQLASIDAGAVLGDLVAAPAEHVDPQLRAALAAACPDELEAVDHAAATGVVHLTRNYRFDGAIADLAHAIRDGDPDRALAVLRSGAEGVEFVTDDDLSGVRDQVVKQTAAMVRAARAGDAEAALDDLDRHRVLCAHREGPYGVGHWDDLIGTWTEHLAGRPQPRNPWYPGRGLLVTANDYAADLYNGDTGVIVVDGGELRAAFPRVSGIALLPLARLDSVQTLRAMTIHRGQGSQFDTVTVVLPPADSPLLTRELLYTAVTRARTSIRVIGSEDAVRAGVERLVRRASGLRL